MSSGTSGPISPESAQTLAGLFRERVRRTPDAVAYRYFDDSDGIWKSSTWREMAREVSRWQAGLEREPLRAGDRIAVMLRNCREWVMFDQAAHGLGLVVVPVYTNDRAESVAYILQDAGVKLLLIEGPRHWEALRPVYAQLSGLARILTLLPIGPSESDPRLRWIGDWLPNDGGDLRARASDPQSLATIVYTSGTTGRPKGVMLSHRNIVWNAYAGLQCFMTTHDDLFLSFLPLSHTFERTVGYYVPMMSGSTVAYTRSITLLAEDMLAVGPTVLITVPRTFERAYANIQARLQKKSALARRLFEWTVALGWRRFLFSQQRAPWTPWLWCWPLLNALVARKILARLGGRLRIAISGAAPLSFSIARLFIGLGLPILQGYGLTETSPTISVNRIDDNDPVSVGVPLPDVQVRTGENQELLIKSPGVMLGYWNLPEATARMIDTQGWLHTGDQARLEHGHIYIIGRIKEIIVLANGEKVPPSDMEMAIATDPLFDHVVVIGEGCPYLSALLVLNPERWKNLAAELALDHDSAAALNDSTLHEVILERIGKQLRSFPGYAQIRRVALTRKPWTVDNGLITPTMKLRRGQILQYYGDAIAALYAKS